MVKAGFDVFEGSFFCRVLKRITGLLGFRGSSAGFFARETTRALSDVEEHPLSSIGFFVSAAVLANTLFYAAFSRLGLESILLRVLFFSAALLAAFSRAKPKDILKNSATARMLLNLGGLLAD